MTRLDPSAQALIGAARDANDPSEEDRAATQAALEARLGAAAFIVPLSAAPLALTKGASAGAAKVLGSAGARAAASGVTKSILGGVLVAKPLALAVGAVVTAGAVMGVVYATQAPPAPARTLAPVVALHAPPVVNAAPVSPSNPSPAAPAPSPIDVVPSPDPVLPVTPAPLAAPPRPAPAVPSAPTLPDRSDHGRLGEEARLLKDVFTDMHDGQADRALLLLDDHAARFPDGAMRAEAAAERVLALCALGRVDEARALAGRFLAAYPTSPLADRVRASCAAAR